MMVTYPLSSVTDWWDRYGDTAKKDTVNTIIEAINDLNTRLEALEP